MLTQTLPAVLAAALFCVGLALRLKRPALLGGLLAGVGASCLWLTTATGWRGQPWVWVVAAVALLVAAVAATRGALRGRNEVDAQRPAFRHSTGVVVATVVASLVLTALSLPVRPGEYALPTGLVPVWLSISCGGVGLDTVVRGSPDDPRVAWLENHMLVPGLPITPRLEAIWPEGYRARFTPRLEVLDGWGNVVLRDGDAVTGACEWRNGDPPEWVLAPPFK